jgi:hypothetical protein
VVVGASIGEVLVVDACSGGTAATEVTAASSAPVAHDDVTSASRTAIEIDLALRMRSD